MASPNNMRYDLLSISGKRWVLIVSCCVLIFFITPITSQKGCGNSCKTLNDCPGQLICTSGKCTDDPDVGTHICTGTGGGSGPGTCKPGTPLQGRNPPSKNACNTDNGDECCTSSKRYTTYDCSPAISSSTPAILTLNDFTQGGDGGGPSSCSGKYYSNTDKVVALSTGWFENGSRCLKKIRINGNGNSAVATVVDECDSRHGCDADHGYQPPCRNNIVDASAAVWDALGVPQDQQGQLSITWSLVN